MHCNAITTAKECQDETYQVKKLRENTICDSYDTNRIQTITKLQNNNQEFTEDTCNAACIAKTGCVQFAIGQEAPYKGDCDLYNTHFCTFNNLE